MHCNSFYVIKFLAIGQDKFSNPPFATHPGLLWSILSRRSQILFGLASWAKRGNAPKSLNKMDLCTIFVAFLRLAHEANPKSIWLCRLRIDHRRAGCVAKGGLENLSYPLVSPNRNNHISGPLALKLACDLLVPLHKSNMKEINFSIFWPLFNGHQMFSAHIVKPSSFYSRNTFLWSRYLISHCAAAYCNWGHHNTIFCLQLKSPTRTLFFVCIAKYVAQVNTRLLLNGINSTIKF